MSFPRYPAYKPSGVEWLGEVPEHWDVKRIASLYSEVVETGHKDLPVLSVSIHHGVSDSELSEEEMDRKVVRSDDRSKYKRVAPGDLVYNMMRAWQGAFGSVVVEGVVSPAYVVARPKTTLPTEWIEYLLRTEFAVNEIKRFSRGITDFRLRLYWDEFKNLRICSPPAEERASILRFLDRETVKIDALIAEQQRLIELLQEKRQAVISHAVTKGLNPNAPMKDSGVEWLGEVPEHWEVIRLKYLTQDIDGVQMGPFGALLIDLESQDTGYKVYGQENVIKQDLELGSRWVSKARFQELERYTLGIGDIAVTRKGSLGNALLIQSMPQPGIGDSDTIRIRCAEERLHPSFLVRLLHEADYINQQLIQLKRGSVLPGLNTETIRGLVVAVPQLHEQEELLSSINEICEEIYRLASQATATESLLKERRSALISAAVTGQIDVRGLVEAEGSEQ
jgi:type I restriction enzyme S subunit